MTQDVRPFQPAGASYSPGGWVALAAGRQWLLLRLAPSDPMMQQCWAALSSGASVEDVLDPLFSTGLASVPDFALFSAIDSGCRTVLRGAAQVRYESTVVTAGDSLLLDVTLTDIPADAAVLLTGGDDADTSLQLPLSAGVTMAGSIRLATGEQPLLVPPPVAAVKDRPASSPPLEPVARVQLEKPVAPVDNADPKAESTAAAATTGEFDHLFAATVLPSEIKKIRDELEADEVPEVAPPEPEVESPPAPSVFHTQQWATRPPYEGTGLIDSVPWMTDPDTATKPIPPAAAPIENMPQSPAETRQDGPQLTVKRSTLAAAAASVAMVMSTRCPAGHPNPPHAARCRNCRQPIPEQEPVEITRPVLGVLRLSTGETISLDRGVLIGREPSEPDPTGIDRPHVLALTDDLQVSRNHVEVSIDGWRVHVADLGSTNGTFVTPAQQPAMRLNERDPQLIEPGTEVRLSDDFSFTYQVGS